MNPSVNQFSELTWSDLILWAGKKTVQEGQKCQQGSNVKQLALTESGGILAWVEAEEIFSTRVEYNADEITTDCSCNSAEHACAHAIAVIIEYIAHLKRNISIPDAEKNDRRLFLL